MEQRLPEPVKGIENLCGMGQHRVSRGTGLGYKRLGITRKRLFKVATQGYLYSKRLISLRKLEISGITESRFESGGNTDK